MLASLSDLNLLLQVGQQVVYLVSRTLNIKQSRILVLFQHEFDGLSSLLDHQNVNLFLIEAFVNKKLKNAIKVSQYEIRCELSLWLLLCLNHSEESLAPAHVIFELLDKALCEPLEPPVKALTV